jgi:hypothetical protein
MAKQVGEEGRGGAVPSGDSPKPHGDKIAGTRPADAGTGRQADEGAVPSGDSPKPHGDKIAGAGRRGTATTGQGGRTERDGG